MKRVGSLPLAISQALSLRWPFGVGRIRPRAIRRMFFNRAGNGPASGLGTAQVAARQDHLEGQPVKGHALTRMALVALVALLGVHLLAGESTAALISKWSAEGDATDSSGNAHNGTLQGSAGFGAGKIGQAFSLDGTDDYVSVPDSNDWAFAGNFTIALWANFDQVKGGVVGNLPNVFVGHDEGGGSNRKWVFFYGEGGLSFHINGLVGSVFLNSSPFSPSTDEWHHFAVTRSSNTYTFYADGVGKGFATDVLAIPDAPASLTIGQAEELGYFDGRLDEIEIYSNALSASEIQSLASIPWPSALLLLGFGLAGLAGIAWRQDRQS